MRVFKETAQSTDKSLNDSSEFPSFEELQSLEFKAKCQYVFKSLQKDLDKLTKHLKGQHQDPEK